MKIKKFNDFEETNEGLKSSLSIIGILIGLGLGKPETILANHQKIEQSISDKDKEVLKFIDSLDSENDTIFNRELPISFLTDSLENYNYKNFKSNLRIEDVVNTTQNPKFPIKVDMFFTSSRVPVTTLEYKHNDNITFIFSKNGGWGNDILGVRFNF